MDPGEIDRVLTDCERAPMLARAGFWDAVAAVKRSPKLVERYADRIGRIDRVAFERRVRLRVPVAAGLTAMLSGAAAGVALVTLALVPSAGPSPWAASPWREPLFLAGVGLLLGTTHTLAHWIVGRLVGIRFTHAFAVLPKRPQPGFKIDYASYLRTPARARAWMHAAGAIVTKLVPFVALPFALPAGLAPWAIWLLVTLGVTQIATDALWSVHGSDWKKFRREMRFVI